MGHRSFHSVRHMPAPYYRAGNLMANENATHCALVIAVAKGFGGQNRGNPDSRRLPLIPLK